MCCHESPGLLLTSYWDYQTGCWFFNLSKQVWRDSPRNPHQLNGSPAQSAPQDGSEMVTHSLSSKTFSFSLHQSPKTKHWSWFPVFHTPLNPRKWKDLFCSHDPFPGYSCLTHGFSCFSVISVFFCFQRDFLNGQMKSVILIYNIWWLWRKSR